MLSINISELILTIINFLLLCFLLKKFLYDPIIKFMDERDARIEAAAKLVKDAEANKTRVEAEIVEKREQVREEARRIVNDGKADDEHKRTAMISEASAEELKNRKAMKLNVSEEKEKLQTEITDNKAELAAMLAKVLMDE